MSKQTKKQKVAKSAAPIISKSQAPAVFAKLIGEAKTYDQAWALIRRTFRRQEWGRVRQIVRALSKFKTLRAAFNAAHGKKQTRRAA